jgi:hypothetical protein
MRSSEIGPELNLDNNVSNIFMSRSILRLCSSHVVSFSPVYN